MSRIHKAFEKAEQESAAHPEYASSAAAKNLGRVHQAVEKAAAEDAAAGVRATPAGNAGRVHEAVEKAEAENAVARQGTPVATQRTDRFFDAVKQAEAEAGTQAPSRASFLFESDQAARSAEAHAKVLHPAPILIQSPPQRPADEPARPGLGSSPAVEPPDTLAKPQPEAHAESPRSGPQLSWALPQWHPDTSRLVFYSGGSWSFAEQFRTLRSRLLNMHRAQPFSTLLVCSGLPDEGKTFVAANLAHALAQEENSRVGLIDADMRAGRAHLRLHDLIGSSFEHGLSDYLAGEAKLEEVLQTGNIPNLSFIPAGSLRSDAAELIGNGLLPELLAMLSRTLDWIVVDSPSFGPIADGLLLAQMCDASLMVVRANSTPVESALRVAQELKRKRLLGVVLNQVPAVNQYQYKNMSVRSRERTV